jgi:hypothetical protein
MRFEREINNILKKDIAASLTKSEENGKRSRIDKLYSTSYSRTALG